MTYGMIRCPLVAMAFLTWLSNANANLVSNGSFEDVTGGLPDSWSVVGNVGIAGAQGLTDGNVAVAFSLGNKPSNGFIHQELTTVPGVEYRLTFDFGKYSVNQPTEVARLEVGVFDSTTVGGFGGPVLLNQLVTDNTPGPGNSVPDETVYDPYVFTFTAGGSSSTLRFVDLSDPQGPGGGFDAMLDNVVVAAVPEPAAAGFLAALCSLLGRRRRRC